MELGDTNLHILSPMIVRKVHWYQRYKRIIWTISIITCIALISIIIFTSVRCPLCKENSSSDYLTGAESRRWSGTCLQTHLECNLSSNITPPLLIISLDGLRAEYLNRKITPTLEKLAECGVKADFMYPVYPSKTFPNHYSIVTGLYPSEHGIIDNYMYDSEMNKYFKVGKTKLNDTRWWQKEPIWVTARKQGKTSACFFWPGSDVKINGSYPNNYTNYDGQIPYETRVDRILKWLTAPNRPDFLTLYFEEPDKSGHLYGPNSEQVNDALVRVDKMLDRLLSGLEVRNLINCVNILVVSDHGMSEISCDRTVDIRNYVDISTVDAFIGTFGRIESKEHRTSTDELASNFQCQESHLRAFRKEQLPIRMHYSNNPRIEDVVLDINSGYFLIAQDLEPGSSKCSGGSHGYDYLFPDMRAIFFAQGPSFKKNITIRPFLNIELYELMCELIAINPQPNNGTRGSLHQILLHPNPILQQTPSPSLSVAEIPANELESQSRVFASHCPCSPMHEEKSPVSRSEVETKFHLPFGMPRTDGHRNSLMLLYNTDYVLAYDTEFKMPLWAAFSINKTRNSTETTTCWAGDARIENARCFVQPEGLLQRPLYPPEFSDLPTQAQAFYITNSIPKTVSHTNLLEGEINNMIERKVSEVGNLNVMIGPVFNDHSNPSLVPTHIFLILTWCTSQVDTLTGCPEEYLEVQSYLLPNYPFTDTCEAAEIVIKRNIARVVDIQGTTDITFFTNLTTYQAVRLQTSMLHFSL